MRTLLATGCGVLATAVWACTTFGASGPGGDEPVDAGGTPPSLDGAPSPDGATVSDAETRPDASPRECSGVPAGTATPCTACEIAEVVRLTGTFAFSLAADATHLYWIEQTDRDGKSGGKVMRARLPDGTDRELVFDASSDAPNKLALQGDQVIVASEQGRDTNAFRIPKGCGGACAAAPIANTFKTRAVAQVPGSTSDVALLLPTEARVGSRSFPAPSPEEAAATPFGGDVAIVRIDPAGGEAAQRGLLLPSGGTFPLALSTGGWGTSRGASRVAADCGDVWAVQFFANHVALVETRPRFTTPSKVYDIGNTFALAADATHVYAARPDSGGLYRASSTEAPRLVSGTMDVWTVAVTDAYVYFDDHSSAVNVRGIRRLKKSR